MSTPDIQDHSDNGKHKRKKASNNTSNGRISKATRSHKPPTKVDVDRQCGVPLPGGGVCARSLTCKTHSMGAKRAVPGRSRPYDILLGEYQQRNQVKQAQKSTVSARREEEEAEHAASGQFERPLTDKEEVEQVLRGVIQSQPLPLVRPRMITSQRSRIQFTTVREMLLGSVNKVPPLSVIHPPEPHNASAGPSLAAVMAATGPILGRCVVYNPYTGAKTTRPARIRMRIPSSHQ